MGAGKKNNRIVNVVVPVFMVLFLSLAFVFACLILKEIPKGQDVEFVKTDSVSGVSLRLKGNSIGILDTAVSEVPQLKSVAGILRSYAVATRARVDALTLTIPYGGLSVSSAFVDILTISRFDPDTGTLYDLASERDKAAQTVTATAEQAGIFCIRLDYNAQDAVEQIQTDVYFLLGSSATIAKSALLVTSRFLDLGFRFGVGSYVDGYQTLAQFASTNFSANSTLNSIISGKMEDGRACLGESMLQASQQFTTLGSHKTQYMVLFVKSGDQSTSDDWVSQMEQGITRCTTLGIRVMAVLVGNEVDTISEYWLKRATDQTGGSLYRVADESGMAELTNNIASDLYFGFADTDLDGKRDAVKLAQTDFLPSLDGFSFRNFQSVQNPSGFGFGMSLLSQLYHKDDLPYAVNATTVTVNGTSYTAHGYYLPDSFRQGVPLSSFKVDEPLASVFQNDQRQWDDATLQNYYLIPQTSRDVLESLGYAIERKEARHESGARKNRRYVYDEYFADIYAQSLIDSVSKDTSEVLAAIHRLDVLQYDSARAEFQSFVTSPQTTLNKLIISMTQNYPAVLLLDEGAHAVTAFSMFASFVDPASYRLGVYDSYSPMQTCYLSIVRRVSVSESESNYIRTGNVLSQTDEPVYQLHFGLNEKSYRDAALCNFKQV